MRTFACGRAGVSMVDLNHHCQYGNSCLRVKMCWSEVCEYCFDATLKKNSKNGRLVATGNRRGCREVFS
jgi:hypothetical protein